MQQNNSVFQLEEFLNQSLKNLESQSNNLTEQIMLFESLKYSVESHTAEDLTVTLGGGYYTRMTHSETLKYLDRRLKHLRESASRTTSKFEHAKQTKENFLLLQNYQAQKETDFKNELPIVDILEEIDDTGNILSVKFKDSFGNEFLQRSMELPSQVSSKYEDAKYVSEQGLIGQINGNGNNIQTEQIRELLSDMEINPETENFDGNNQQNDHKMQTTSNGELVTDSVKAAKIKSSENAVENRSPNSMDTRQIYELELLASEFGDNQLSLVDEDGFNYDFDDEQSDSIDSSSSDDDFIYGMLLPKNDKLQNRLWQEVKNLRKKKQVEGERLVGLEIRKSDKLVRFSEKLEIKEIENVSDSLKQIEHSRSKVLKFKENKILSRNLRDETGNSEGRADDNSKTSEMVTNADDFKRELITSDIIEHDYVNMEPMISDSFGKSDAIDISIKLDENCSFPVGEAKNPDDITLLQEEMRKEQSKEKRSKFKKLVAQNPLRVKPSLQVATKIEIFDSNVKSANQFDQVNEIDQGIKATDVDVKNDIKELNVDLPNLQHDMDTMVQAYNIGLFDDDIEVSGPVVDLLEDFKTLNEMIKSMPSEPAAEYSWQSHSGKFDEDSDDAIDFMISSESDNEILKEQIVENDFFSDEDDSQLNTHDDVQLSVIQQEVTENYFRLKQKVLSKELVSAEEFEPIDGTPRTSRFKAARRQIV